MHANYPYLAAGAKVYRPDSSRSNLLVGPDGDRIAGPPGHDIVPNYYCGSISVFTGTGPYREIYSKCNTPYVFSDVWVPCNDYTYMHYYPNETAYAYTGGFSSTGNAVDAGFQYSSSLQNWALIVRGSHGQLSNLTRFRCDQTLSLAFYPVSSTLLTAYANGYTTSGVFQGLTQTYGVYSTDGWSNECHSCVVKRVTSIGQGGGFRDRFNTGSYFGMFIPTLTPEVNWSNAYVGFWTGHGATYNAYSWSNVYTGGFNTYPNDTTRMFVIFYDYADEVDGIDLHP